jgi:hypothetical protein
MPSISLPVAAVLNMLLALFMNPLSQEVIFSESMGQSPKLVVVFFELFTPYGLFGEPLNLLAYELLLWLVGIMTVSVSISMLYRGARV